MVSIVPADESRYRELLRDSDKNVKHICLSAVGDDQEFGHIVCTVYGYEVQILSLSAQEYAIADCLVRASLNAAREKGAVTAMCIQEAIFPVLLKLGFGFDELSVRPELVVKIEPFLKCKCSKS